MARRVLLLLVFLVMIVSLGFFSFKGFAKTQHLEKEQDTNIFSGKIDEILKNQQAIIAQLKDIKSELGIIKIRASRK